MDMDKDKDVDVPKVVEKDKDKDVMSRHDFDDPFSVKLDMCFTDGIVKTGTGVLLGAITSFLFLRRRRWPLIVGMGMGIGVAYGNCEINLKEPKECPPKVGKLACNPS